MTTLREAAQQALLALEKATRFMTDSDYKRLNETIEVLRAALAEPQVEPVAWLIKWVNANDGVPQGEWQRGYDAARNVVRAHLKAAQQVVNQEMTTEQCPCGDRPAAECPGEWEPGCDLGANEAHVKVHEPQKPVVNQQMTTEPGVRVPFGEQK